MALGTAGNAASADRSPANPAYCGRFAPSPTGELHLGSLLAATGSYLAACAVGGRWLVRMEDLDQDREVPGAADRILRTLEAFGFQWHGAVARQSQRTAYYEEAVESLQAAGRVFRCTCTRARLSGLPRTPGGEAIYPGTCRDAGVPPDVEASLRFHTGPAGRAIQVTDALQGPMAQDVAVEVGDFVIRRRDGFHAYQLAVVVDDASQQVTEVVRGCDLLDNTPRQVLLQQALGLPTPGYAHLPLLLEPDGAKLSKRARAVPLQASKAPETLHMALDLLGQSPPAELRRADVRALWAWAAENWDPAPLRGRRAIRL